MASQAEGRGKEACMPVRENDADKDSHEKPQHEDEEHGGL